MLSSLKTLAAVAALAAAGSGAAIAGPLKSGMPAPEFTGIEKWLNSEPLTMQQLRGKVVLVDFWTYTCINCINTLPHLKSWHQKYKDQGLVVVGVHTPEYPFERSTDNVKTAIKRFDLRFPVAQDNRYATWGAYNNQFWPASYLIDKKGQVVYSHFGEGQYAQTEAAIQALLAQP
jgi:thiol-disulfide isomerase/thioredoxin